MTRSADRHLGVLRGYPRLRDYTIRCVRCAGEARVFEAKAWFHRRDYATIVEEAAMLPFRAEVHPARAKGDQVRVYFFPDLYNRRSRVSSDVSICSECGDRRRAAFCWPRDAYFQARVRGVRLWAYDRKHLVELRDYIARGATRGQGFHKLPATITSAKNRDLVLKTIDSLLAGRSPAPR